MYFPISCSIMSLPSVDLVVVINSSFAFLRPVSRRVQLKRNSFSNSSRQTEPQAKLKRDSNTTGIRRFDKVVFA